MHKSLWLLVILALVACGGEPRTVVVPPAPVVEVVSNDHIAELIQKFPLQPRMLSDKETIKELARLKLHPVILTKDTVMLNYFREIRKFVRDTIRAGTMVYADETGMIRYKADCWNLLAEMSVCGCNVLPAVLVDSSGQRGGLPGVVTLPPTIGGGVDITQGNSFWSDIGEAIGFLFKWFLILLLALLLLWAAALVARELFAPRRNQAVIPHPVVPPAPLPHEGGRRRRNILPFGVGRRHGEQDRRHHDTVPVGFGRRRGENDRRSGYDRRDEHDRRQDW